MPEPGNPQSLNRYSYVLNNPIRFIDPSGNFTEDAVYQYILNYECGGSYNCADQMIDNWSNDTGWWLMLMTAEAGDMLYGMDSDGPGRFQFMGSGDNKLTGLVAWGGEGPGVKLSGFHSGEYQVRVGWTTTHSADWEALLFHDTGYVVTRSEFNGIAKVLLYGSQYEAPTVGSVIRAMASGAVKSAVKSELTSKCGRARKICGIVASGILAGIKEATKVAPNEPGDEERLTEHWIFHSKPDFANSTRIIDITTGMSFRTTPYFPPTIRWR